MKSFISGVLITASITGCTTSESDKLEKLTTMQKHTTTLSYPVTPQKMVTDTLFGEQVADPYRWLEDDTSDETAKWVLSQNKVTDHYLEQIPYRQNIKERLTQLWNYERVSAPVKEGKYSYFFKNDGLQNQSLMYRRDEQGNQEVFLDPNTFSEDATTSLANYSFSKDGSKLAYAISEGGSDWRKIILIDVETKQQLETPLIDVKFSGISWLGNDGFYYSSYDKPDGSELSAKTDQHKLYYHKLATNQKDDPVIFGGTDAEKHRYVSADVTEDDNYLLISASVSTSGNKLFLKDLTQTDSPLITILDHTDSDTYLLDNRGSQLYLLTNLDAPNKKVISVDANNPAVKNWQDVLPETDDVLSVSTGAGYIFAEYSKAAISHVEQYDYEGKKVRELRLPGVGSVGSFEGKKQDTTLYFGFTNYTTPYTIYSLNPASGEYQTYVKPNVAFNSDDYESKQVFYPSKDGTKVPMIITYKKGIKLDGTNPTQLYGYGGFNISLTPYYASSNAGWLDLGGVLAVANLRGGGEFGKKWHNAGTKLQKQNVFDDFIAAAQYLNNEGYANSKHLMIRGGSNGGLLVGAVMNQYPALAQVAIPQVGVLDMLRYHTFTAGAGWAYDYGTANDSKEMFEYLKAYSPVHNVKSGVNYPATMITTADHDDRVVPAHSFKFAAQLQTQVTSSNPLLIRIETNAGHGAGKPTDKAIEEYADIFAFGLFNMGIKTL